jgi:parallel beta-helix repeat protein
MKCIIRGIIVVVLLLSSFNIGIGYIIRDEVDGCDCEDIGTWSPGTLTCTLTGDVDDNIEIDDDGITLDGNGYSATGIYVHENSGYIIENFVGDLYISILGLESHCDSGIIRGNAITGVEGTSIGIRDANYIEITDNTISHCRNSGISLSGSSNINITDNTIHDNKRGICCSDGSQYNNIIDNTIHDNNYCGIYCSGDSQYNNIIGNIINDTYYGIYCDIGSYYNNIMSNVINDNRNGITVRFSRGNIISDNVIFNNTNKGINLYKSYCNTINSNSISDNSCGIYMLGNNDDDGNNSIFCNNISNSGITIYFSKGNFFYHNNIVSSSIYENLKSGSNQWYMGTTGNHWGDYDETCESCVDSNDDRICDSPYDIPGSTGRDMYPMVYIDWRDEWMNVNSDGGTKVTTVELQDAIHHWLEDEPIRCHVLSLADIQEVIAAWLLG